MLDLRQGSFGNTFLQRQGRVTRYFRCFHQTIALHNPNIIEPSRDFPL
jgi:hypothetical protein